jgi:alkylation response protein AidB-like acyl-CoA dehydrogenase
MRMFPSATSRLARRRAMTELRHMDCLAFAERDHGSDLAGVQTRGDVTGNEIIVTGVKTWVAGANTADAALVLCRTAPQELSCVRVQLPDEAVELRPIRVLSGDNDLFELQFEAARAPLGNLVGDRGDGLVIATRELSNAQWLDVESEFWEVVEAARHYGRNRDPLVRQQLAWAYAQVRTIGALIQREPLLARVIWSEYHRRFGEIAIDLTGSDGLLRQDGEGYKGTRWQQLFLASRADTIANRTSEVQRDVIAEQLLRSG